MRNVLAMLMAMVLLAGCTISQPAAQQERNITELSLEELNKGLDKYNGARVSLVGYFGHKKWHGRTGMSYLVKGGEWLIRNTRYEEFNYVRLDSDAPETLEGKKIAVEGVVSIGEINLPIKYQRRVAVIKVENYSVIG